MKRWNQPGSVPAKVRMAELRQRKHVKVTPSIQAKAAKRASLYMHSAARSRAFGLTDYADAARYRIAKAGG